MYVVLRGHMLGLTYFLGQKQIDPQILTKIREEKSISDSLNEQLKSFFDSFTTKFLRT